MAEAVTEFAPAKINLALHVLGRRADGYHDLDSAVAFADVGDTVEISPAAYTQLIVSGPFAAEVPTTRDNLVLKAYEALASVNPLSPMRLQLMKNLPVASGIGGGSADAAAALRGILKFSSVSIDTAKLNAIALSLGADVPVCLHNKACRMQGVGDRLSGLPQLPSKAIVLVNPLISCSTADVFRRMGLKAGDTYKSALDPTTPATWRNDMTSAAIAILPEVGQVLQSLQKHAPTHTVRMSGSGATCFALCDDIVNARKVGAAIKNAHPNWWVAPARLT
jgi:4-diphosphocytidyl-2-C-methyl-D-erythritol kinase